MTKEEVKALAEKRGFTLWATYGDGKLQFMDRYGINITITPETVSFEMAWMVPNSIFIISSPPCSSFSNDEHFNKMYKKFKRTVLMCRDALIESEPEEVD